MKSHILLISFLLLFSCIAFVNGMDAVGDSVCAQGYPMDYFCIEQGFLLDNTSVITLEEPNKHSVHCLIDVQSCITSPFEILTAPVTIDTTNTNSSISIYTRSYRLDDATKKILIDLAKKAGLCGDCDSTGTIQTGLKVAVQGMIVAIQNGKIPAIVKGNVILANPKKKPYAKWLKLQPSHLSVNLAYHIPQHLLSLPH
jgi:hypothetical protein